jgi:transcription elongation factor Elf1
MAKNKKNKKSYSPRSQSGVIGVLNYEKKKKKKETDKDILRKRKKRKQKELEKKAVCNHIAKNDGRTHLEPVEGKEGVMRCKICGAEIINDEKMMTPDMIEMSELILYSVFAYYKNRTKLSPESVQKISNAIRVNAMAIEMYETLKQRSNTNKKINNKRKGKKNKKKGKKQKTVYPGRFLAR